jgi:hypothetical protein
LCDDPNAEEFPLLTKFDLTPEDPYMPALFFL